MITHPPESITATLGTNATFTCHGNGQVFWEISDVQVVSAQPVQTFVQAQIYVPLPIQGFSELIMTVTAHNNITLIQCLVATSNLINPPVESEIVHLLVYGECKFSYFK